MQQLRDYTAELKDRHTLLSLARIFQCLTLTKNDPSAAADLVRTRGDRKWSDNTQLETVLKAAVAGQSAGGDSSLIPITGLNLLGLVRQMAIVDRLPGVVKVPFGTQVVTTLSGTASSWVGEGKPVPVSKPQYSKIAALTRLKVSTLAVQTKELVLSAHVDAQLAVASDFVRACVVARDSAFIDVQNSGTSGAKPASITSGAPAFASTGITVATIDADLGRCVDSLSAHGSTLESACWIMHPLSAAFLSRLRVTSSGFAYPDISVLGGMLMGLPVPTSASVPHVGSPQSASIALVDGSRVWLAADDTAEIDTSEEAAFEQLDNPTNATTPTATTMTSMFQSNAIALRGNQTLNWALAEAGAVAVLNELGF